MANAAEILTLATQWGVEMILHGHDHQPSITVAHRWPVEREGGLKPIISVGAGSCGARDHLGPIARNQYFIVYRRRDSIIIRSRCMDENGLKFARHDDVKLSARTGALRAF